VFIVSRWRRRAILSGSGSSLRLLNVTESDAGVLQCNASNHHGYVFANVYLTVHGWYNSLNSPKLPIVISTNNIQSQFVHYFIQGSKLIGTTNSLNNAQYTPPTRETIELRRVGAVNTIRNYLMTTADGFGRNLENDQTDSIAVWLREFWSILIASSTMAT